MLSPPVFAIAALARSWKAKPLELITNMAWLRIAMVLRCHLSTLDPMVRMSRVDWCLPQTTSLVPISRHVCRLQPQDAEKAVPAQASTLPRLSSHSVACSSSKLHCATYSMERCGVAFPQTGNRSTWSQQTRTSALWREPSLCTFSVSPA